MALAKKIRIESLYTSFKDEVETVENSINSSLIGLRENRINIESVKELNEVSPDWLRSFIEDQEKRAKGNFSGVLLPGNLVTAMERGYKDMYNNCLPYAEQLQKDLFLYPNIRYEIKNGEFAFNLQDLEKEAEKASLYEFSEEEVTYYGYLEELAALKTKIHTFEKKNGYSTTSRPSESFVNKYRGRTVDVNHLIEDKEDGGFSPISPVRLYEIKMQGLIFNKESEIIERLKKITTLS